MFTCHQRMTRSAQIFLFMVGLSAVACGSSLPTPTAAPDIGADSGNVAVDEATEAGASADAADGASADAADSDRAGSDTGNDTTILPDGNPAPDTAKYPDCSKPQTEDCPCSITELSNKCCFKVTDGLTCKKKVDGALKWQAFQDCCRDPKPGCEKHNPIPTPPWCNGMIP